MCALTFIIIYHYYFYYSGQNGSLAGGSGFVSKQVLLRIEMRNIPIQECPVTISVILQIDFLLSE